VDGSARDAASAGRRARRRRPHVRPRRGASSPRGRSSSPCV
jgi:hypothetical protein